MATLVGRDEFNVYESADARFEAAARKLGLEEGVYRFLKYPNKEITVYIPVVLDNGHLEALKKITKDYNIADDEKTIGFLLAIVSKNNGQPIQVGEDSFLPGEAIKKKDASQ